MASHGDDLLWIVAVMDSGGRSGRNGLGRPRTIVCCQRPHTRVSFPGHRCGLDGVVSMGGGEKLQDQRARLAGSGGLGFLWTGCI